MLVKPQKALRKLRVVQKVLGQEQKRLIAGQKKPTVERKKHMIKRKVLIGRRQTTHSE